MQADTLRRKRFEYTTPQLRLEKRDAYFCKDGCYVLCLEQLVDLFGIERPEFISLRISSEPDDKSISIVLERRFCHYLWRKGEQGWTYRSPFLDGFDSWLHEQPAFRNLEHDEEILVHVTIKIHE